MRIYATRILDISDEVIGKLCLSIDSEKRGKVEKLVNKKDKIRTLIGEILIRTEIVKEIGIRNEHIKFRKNQYGKPYVNGHSNFNFNISHSGDFVLCAIDDKPIGIDVEEVKSFSVDIDDHENIKVVVNNQQMENTLKSIEFDKDYKMALCSLKDEVSSHIIWIEQNSLISSYLELE